DVELRAVGPAQTKPILRARPLRRETFLLCALRRVLFFWIRNKTTSIGRKFSGVCKRVWSLPLSHTFLFCFFRRDFLREYLSTSGRPYPHIAVARVAGYRHPKILGTRHPPGRGWRPE